MPIGFYPVFTDDFKTVVDFPLSGFAYTLFERLRHHLKNTPFERMSAHSLRLKANQDRADPQYHPTDSVANP